MLVIRKAQMDEFAKYELKRFEDHMVIHLREKLSEKVKDISEDMLRSTVQKGISDSEKYGIKSEDDVERYIDLMFILGRDFDTAESSAWAGEVLKEEAMSPEERLDKILELTGGR
jgi:hypothetical protein